MLNRFPSLLSPITVNGVTFKNRIAAAPQSIPGSYRGWFKNVGLSWQGMKFFLEKARGGCGLVTVGEIDICDDFFQKPDQFELLQFTTLARGIRNYGAVASLELGFRGEKVYGDHSPDAVRWGPSSVIDPHGEENTMVLQLTGMTEDDMREVCRRYVQAVDVARQCGYGMVMIHGGHGFTLSQFLSPIYNKRTDQYGGSIENRARFPIMVLRAIREKVGYDLLIEYKISADEIVPEGVHIGEVAEAVKLMSPYIDIVQATAGSLYQGPDNNMISTVYRGKTPNLKFAEAFKKALDIKVCAIGAFSDPAEADQAIADGKCDFICFSRQTLADSHYANKLTDGEPEEVNVCLRCTGCMSAPPPSLYAKCTVSPTANYEFLYDYEITPAPKKKRVAVVGGGPAGMTAAITAADRGHEVILFEKSRRLGGIVNFADSDFYKERIVRWRDGMLQKLAKRPIDLRLGVEATPELIGKLAPDALIMAAGSIAAVPPIPGIENAVHVLDMYAAADDAIGRRVLMIGGGLAGCEAALSLQAKGHAVTIVEMLKEFAPDAYPQARGAMLRNLNARVTCLSGRRCLEIFPDGARVRDENGGEAFIGADTVVFALGMKAVPTDAFRNCAPRFCAVGDCLQPAKLMEAIHGGYFAAMSL